MAAVEVDQGETAAPVGRQPVVIVAGGLALCLLLLVLEVTEPFRDGVLDAVALSVLALVTVVVPLGCVRAARRGGPAARTWWWFSASAAAWMVGELLWSLLEIVQHRSVPFPGLPDIGFLLAPPCAWIALLGFPGAPWRAVSRLRVVLDGLIIAGSTFAIAWWLDLRPAFAHSRVGPLATVLGVIYPVLDLVTIGILVLVFSRTRGRRQQRVLIVASMLLMLLGDVLFQKLSILGQWDAGTVAMLPFLLSLAVLAAAASAESGEHSPATEGDGLVGALVPFAPMVAALGVRLYEGFLGNTHDVVGFWLVPSVGFVVVARQALSFMDNVRLRRDLQRTVEERTADLSGALSMLQKRESDFRLLFADNPLPMGVYDVETLQLLEVNNAALEKYGYSREHMLQMAAVDLRPPEDRDAVEQFMRNAPHETRHVGPRRHQLADGTLIDIETDSHPLDFNGRRAMLVVVHDVTAQRRLEDELRHAAWHDSLTGLPNRALLLDRIGHAIAALPRQDGHLAVAILDLDGFKTVNDSQGHAVGDAIIVAVSQRLQACVRGGDTAARLGGDEFAFVFASMSGPDEAAAIGERICAALSEPIRVGDRTFEIGGSMGVCVFEEGLTPTDLLRNADVAMYAAKARGRGQVATFESQMHETLVRRLLLEVDLREALVDRQFELHYQPIVTLSTGRVFGLEALVRWRHPERGLVAPAEFIPLAESTGLIAPLGRWVLREACTQAARLTALYGGQGPILMSVNVSAGQLAEARFVGDVEQVLQDSGLAPEQLILEITETLLVDDQVVCDRLHALKALGVRLALDDFGTGYSALSYLQRLPIDILKLDKGFVSGVARGNDESALARAVVKIGHALRLQVVAEGVESPRQADALEVMGCELAQGYYFARPMDAAAVEGFLERSRMQVDEPDDLFSRMQP